ncbi:hypothetical protein BER2_3723 [plant metagenome]|uniref:Uncharacterized protein n=1 Tax=plant metagenome TaxID=1297885 RepID=A0A484S8T9_9ZZZZ
MLPPKGAAFCLGAALLQKGLDTPCRPQGPPLQAGPPFGNGHPARLGQADLQGHSSGSDAPPPGPSTTKGQPGAGAGH